MHEGIAELLVGLFWKEEYLHIVYAGRPDWEVKYRNRITRRLKHIIVTAAEMDSCRSSNLYPIIYRKLFTRK